MKNSWIHHAKGQYARQAHIRIPQGLKEEEVGRDGFQGRVAELYRKNEPTRWVRVEGEYAPGDVDGEKITVDDEKDPSAGRAVLWHNDDIIVSVSQRREPQPYYFRNADADELWFIHRGEGTLETEFGPLEFAPGDYLVVPKGITQRIAPRTSDNYFLHIESVEEIAFAEHELLGRHNPFDPDVIEVPEPKALSETAGEEYELRVQRDGEITAFFFDTHPIDVVGWKGDLFPFRFHNTDFRPVTADRNHVPPTAFALFRMESWTLCNFVPHPFQRDPEAPRLPYYHRNVDYDEIGFLHAGMVDGIPMEGTSIMWHPRGAVHGPGEEVRRWAGDNWVEVGINDIQAVNIDTVRPLKMSQQARAALRHHVQLTVGKQD